MKALWLLAVLLAAIWLWQRRTGPHQNTHFPASQATPAPLNMVCCSQCGVHIPDNECLAGAHGVYCSQEHLQQSEF